MTGSRVKVLWVLGLLVSGVAAGIPQPALAQSAIFDFFDPGARRQPPQRRYAPRYDYQQQQQPGYYYDEGERWRQRYELRERGYRPRMRVRDEISSDSPKWTELPKDTDAKNILVIGDQLADGLAQGLREAFAADTKAAVRDAAKDGMSLVGKKGEALLTLAKEKVNSENPSAIVIMLGANERRDMDENGKGVDFQSERWRTLYLERIDSLLQAAREKHVPVYWVGLPSARNKQLSGVMAYLNDLYLQKSYVRNAKYVDVWEGFVDEDSNYMVIGPDVNGNQRRLRQRDGITLTPAGNRKLAFYVEKFLRRDLSFAKATIASVNPAANPATVEEASKAVPIPGSGYTGPVISLSAAQGVENAALIGDRDADTTGSVQVTSAIKPGRSDDFAWPPEQKQQLPQFKGEAKPESKVQKKKN